MAGSVNKVIIIGSLGRDPEIRTLNNGERVANLSVATSEQWRDKSTGEKKEKTEWHRVVIMNDKIADIAEKYLRKGSLAYIEGSLQTRKWTDQQGQERYSTEIVIGRFSGSLTLLGGGSERSEAPASKSSADEFRERVAQTFDMEDEIPF